MYIVNMYMFMFDLLFNLFIAMKSFQFWVTDDKPTVPFHFCGDIHINHKSQSQNTVHVHVCVSLHECSYMYNGSV